MPEVTALYDLSHSELAELLSQWGEPRYRADQVWSWLYRSLVSGSDEMGNLPLELRSRLAAATEVAVLSPLLESRSASGHTSKVLFRLRDGNTVEAVLMGYHGRRTVCVSTQAGCGMGCTFCATGQGGLARNLSGGEIVAQVLYFARQLRQREIENAEAGGRRQSLPSHPITHVVLMGMGEPMANYEATWRAIGTLADERGYHLGARRMTISTVGIVPGIRRLTHEGLPVNLAISLHAADDTLRSSLVPVNRRYPLSELMNAVRDYVKVTRRRVTFEYALIAGVNDSSSQARKLGVMLADILCHVNLIPLNPTPGSKLQASSRERVSAFRDELERHGIPTTVRMRRGLDIQAGCGQLRLHHNDEEDS